MNPPLYRAKRISGEWSYGLLTVLKKSTGRLKAGSYISNVVGWPFAFEIDPSTLEIQTSSGEFKPLNKAKII